MQIMIFWNSSETKKHLRLMLELDRQVFAEGLLYRETPEVLARIQSPFSIYASAASDDGKQMIAYLSLSAVCERYYQKLLAGEASEDEFEPWDQKDTAVLFLRNLVVKDRRATPYVFRLALRELLQTCDENDLYLHRCFTIASHWITRRALERYGFEEVALYKQKYPIMLASRDRSAVLNSFLKKYAQAANP